MGNTSRENSDKRYLSGISVWAISFGCIIGWGSIVMPGTDFLPDAGPVGTLCGIIIAALMVLIICRNYSHLAKKYPEAAGSYIYTRNILGEDHAFLAAWSLELAYISLFWANATAFILIGRYLIGDVLEFGFHYQVEGYDVYFGEVLVTIAIMWIFGLITCYGKRLANFLRTFFAIVLFISVLILFFGILLRTGFHISLAPHFSTGESHFMQILNVAILAPWLFVGFETVAHSVPETKTEVNKIFKIAGVAVLSGMLVYVMLALTAAAGTPNGYNNWSEYVADLPRLQGTAGIPVIYNAEAMLGGFGVFLIGVIAFSTLATSVLGFHRASARIIKIMSEGGLLPERLSKINGDGVPVRASLLVLIISLPIPFLGRTAVGWNADVSTLSVAIVYAYISICAFKSAGGPNELKTKISGICGIAASALVLFCLLVPNIFSKNALAKESYFMLAVWSLLGIIYYWYVFRRDKEHRFGKSTVMWLMMLFILFFSANVWVRLDLQDKVADVFGQDSAMVDFALMKSSIIQLAIIAIALLIMFSLFSTMLHREKELDRRIVQAEERNKAKTDFLSNMSHDIRTPMNAIVGFTDLALLDTGNKSQVEEYLEKIKASSAHLLSLINDVLEMSRIESGKIELENGPVNLPKLLEDLNTIIQGQAKDKKQELTMDASNITDKTVLCDKLRLNQVMLNLVSNAVKYTQEGGKISVKISQTSKVSDGRANYEIHVKDNGMGMTPEFAEKVFEAFEREKTSTVSGIQGTGLGMAITKRIVDMMGGEIKVETEPEKGTEFIVSVSFEVTEDNIEEKSRDKKADLEAIASAFKGKRLLLVDDMQINRQIARAMLKMHGFEIDEAGNGKEAVEAVNNAAPGYYDAVLMDIQMPEMNGYEASQAIRALHDKQKSSVPIVAMTANAFDEDIKNAHNAGMTAHLAKPIDREKLIEVLGEVL